VNAKILDTLLTAIKRVSSESLNTEQDGYSSLSLNEEAFFESRELECHVKKRTPPKSLERFTDGCTGI